MVGPGGFFNMDDLEKMAQEQLGNPDSSANTNAHVNDIATMPFDQLLAQVRERVGNSLNKMLELRTWFAHAQWMLLTDASENPPRQEVHTNHTQSIPIMYAIPNNQHVYLPTGIDHEFDIDVQENPACTKYGVILRMYNFRMGRPFLLRCMVESTEKQMEFAADFKTFWSRRNEQPLNQFGSFELNLEKDFFGYNAYFVEYIELVHNNPFRVV